MNVNARNWVSLVALLVVTIADAIAPKAQSWVAHHAELTVSLLGIWGAIGHLLQPPTTKPTMK